MAYYNVNRPSEPHQRLRLPLPALRVQLRRGRSAGLRDERRARSWPAAREAAAAGCTELHVVGGVHPGKEFSWYAGILRRLHEACPQLHLKAFTAVEIAWFARAYRPAGAGDPRRADRRGPGEPARRRGRNLRPPRSARQICPRKPDAAAWLAVHRTAHQLGLRSNATMLYGHVETAGPADRPPPAAAGAAGRDGRLPGLHPAGLPSGEHRPGRPAAGRPACWTCARSPSAG